MLDQIQSSPRYTRSAQCSCTTDGGSTERNANEETGFGKAEDKREKNRFAAEDVWNAFRNMKTVGVIKDNGNVVEIASPRGVVAAIIPSTNPTSTAIFKIIIAIKSRNTIVLSPHPSAARCIAETTRILREAGIKRMIGRDGRVYRIRVSDITPEKENANV